MTTYFTLKWLHILSSVLLVGTGFGSAFYLFFTHRTGNQQAITQVIRLVVCADNWFTIPTIILQPITGFTMWYLAGFSLTQTWVIWTIALYLLAGACWVPVYFLQLRMQTLANDAQQKQQPLPQVYWQYAKYWEWLGYPAFIAMLAIFWLMVFKPV